MRLAVDTWAFVENFFNGPRQAEVAEAMRKAETLVTSREIVAETCNVIVARTGRTNAMREWLSALRAGRTRVLELPMEKTEAFIRGLGPASMLSYADASLSLAAQGEEITNVASDETAFRGAGLTPIFANEARRR
jgi:hypothetical protein